MAVSRWYQHSGMHRFVVCPVCAVQLNWDSYDAAWDGTEWRGDRDLAIWRADWCRQTGHDPETAEARWRELTSSMPASYEHSLALCQPVWLLIVEDESLGADETLEVVRAALSLHDAGALELERLPDIRARVEASRARWEAHYAAVWEGLNDHLRARIAALGQAPTKQSDFASMSVGEAAEFTDVVERILLDYPLEWRDHYAWAVQPSGSEITFMRIRGLLTWTRLNSVSMPDHDPPEDEPRQRFGPNTGEVNLFLSEVAALDDTDWACLHVVMRLDVNGDYDPADGDLEGAMQRTSARRFRLLLDYVWDELYRVAAEDGWRYEPDWTSPDPFPDGRLDIWTPVSLAALAVASVGLDDPRDLDTISGPYRRALASAQRIRAEGGRACAAAAALAPTWDGRLDDFENVVLTTDV